MKQDRSRTQLRESPTENARPPRDEEDGRLNDGDGGYYLRIEPSCSAPPISKLAKNRNTTKLSEAIPNTAAINNAPLICAAFSLCFADKYAPLKSIPPPCLALRAIATRRTLHG